jgi:hypothetical protein
MLQKKFPEGSGPGLAGCLLHETKLSFVAQRTFLFDALCYLLVFTAALPRSLKHMDLSCASQHSQLRTVLETARSLERHHLPLAALCHSGLLPWKFFRLSAARLSLWNICGIWNNTNESFAAGR